MRVYAAISGFHAGENYLKVIKRQIISKMLPKLNKQNVMDEEMEEIRRSLSFLSEDLSKVSRQRTKLIKLMDEVKKT